LCRNHSRSRLSSKRGLLLRMSGAGAVVSSRCAERRCALGALIAAAYGVTNDLDHAHNLALRAVCPLYGIATLVNINDLRGHAAVLVLLDEVIAKS
jgi:hypothetical protein